MFIHCASIMGKRNSNEDQHDTIINFDKRNNNLKDITFLGIYDGHGGKDISRFVKNNLSQFFVNNNIKFDPSNKDYPIYIKRVFNHLQNKLKNNLYSIASHIGSTALVTILYESNNRKYIHIANLGDSRAIICNGNNIGIQLTKDHKPTSFEENKRIKSLGGIIKFEAGDWRIKDLSVSRSFGDLDANPYVCSDPELFKYEINKKDKFIVMACDGLWDVLSNQDVVDFVLTKLDDNKNNNKDQLNTNNKSNIAKLLADHAVANGSFDNISVVILFFG